MNLTADEADDYAYMVANGASVYYRVTPCGTGQWKYGCTQTNAGAGEDAGLVKTDGGPDGGSPTYVRRRHLQLLALAREAGSKFRFAFSTPTNYVNCQNSRPRACRYRRRVEPARHPGLREQWRHRPGDGPHGPPLLGEVRGGHPGSLGSDRHPVRRRPTSGRWLHRVAPRGLPRRRRSRASPTTRARRSPGETASGPYYSPPGNGTMFFTTLSVPVCPGGVRTRRPASATTTTTSVTPSRRRVT